MKVYHFESPSDPYTINTGDGTVIRRIPGHPAYARVVSDLLEAPVIHTNEWQGMDTTGSKFHDTHELQDVSLVWEQIPDNLFDMMPEIDEWWVKEHFLERVSGIPVNPAPSHVRWPYAVRSNGDHTTEQGAFDHTYPERFWPKHAGDCHGGYAYTKDGGVQTVDMHGQGDLDDICGGRSGIRFHYGDLQDVVDLLVRSPLTRQAYLPVWFPEDTGAVDGQRVPCSLGYHFMQRDGYLSCRYYIRSCDAWRHLSNDVWFAARLTDWVAQQVTDESGMSFRNGGLIMHISSLHSFTNDDKKLKERMEKS
jgi:hypothetical protein